MKKLVLTLALAVFAFAANAQFIISANIGGSISNGSAFTDTRVSGGLEYHDTMTVKLMGTSSLNAGLKLGYKFGKIQVGVAGSFNQTSYTNQPLDHSFLPILEDHMPNATTTGYMNSKVSSIIVAPYFRYDIIQAGDISLFAEIDLLYSKTNFPQYTATIFDTVPLSGYSHHTDTNFVLPNSSTTLGARIIPGLSWQLSKNCGIDLYLDFLSLAYTKSSNIVNTVDYDLTFTGTTLNSGYTITTTEIKETYIGGAFNGSPALTKIGANNWVRVGFNFTF